MSKFFEVIYYISYTASSPPETVDDHVLRLETQLLAEAVCLFSSENILGNNAMLPGIFSV